METFLGKLADEILNELDQQPGNHCVVFHSRRASVFFQDTFARKLSKAGRVPDTCSFEDFVAQRSGKTFADQLTQAFEIYPAYLQIFPEEPFDKFYSWAGTLLEGFEEAGHALADVQKLFAGVHQLKLLDRSIERWSEEREESPYRERFLRLWEAVPGLYGQLHRNLAAKGLSTLSRCLAELCADPGWVKDLPWDKVWFAGFGTLTKAEEQFILLLVQSGKGALRWDLDPWYLDNSVQEAGKYFRGFRQRHPELASSWIEPYLSTGEKTLTFCGVAGRIAQAKAAGIKIATLPQAEIDKNTAVVLPDEGLLFPLLHALPEQVKEINVTMGYPLRGTPIFALADGILQLHENAATIEQSRGKYLFYHRDATALLRHPYLRAVCPESAPALAKLIRDENLVYLSAEETAGYLSSFADAAELLHIFSPPADADALTALFFSLLQSLRNALEEKQAEGKARSDTEIELLFHFRGLMLKLRDRLGAHRDQISLKTFRRVFRELIRPASVPFSGEPLSGLQVMGVLETRGLDFENLIILSVNEGVFPKTSADSGLIPFSVRKAFGLPTYEDRDALFAYHFYRLLQRAKNITLIYNTEPDPLGGSEPGRYISQLRAELAAANPHLHIIEERLSFAAMNEAPPPILISKTDEILHKIMTYGSEKGFSPSALNSYLACSLQFYLRYVEGLKERDEVEESAEARTFGSVFHAVMDALYRPFTGRKVTAQDVQELIKAAPEMAREKFKEAGHSRNLDHGKNHLLLKVVTELALKALELDKEQAPFHLHALEQNLEWSIEVPAGTVKLRGVLDRVDETGGFIRIVDYKTGDTGSLKIDDPARAGESGQRREAFQLATYALLYLSDPLNPRPVQSGILSLRNLSKGIQLLEMGAEKETALEEISIAAFRERVLEVIHEILSREVLFSQTPDKDTCRFCDYQLICNRQ